MGREENGFRQGSELARAPAWSWVTFDKLFNLSGTQCKILIFLFIEREGS